VITPMKKVTFVGLEAEKDRFIQRLQEVGVTHLILPKEAVEAQDLARELQRTTETRKILAKKGTRGIPEKKLDHREVCSKREEMGQLETRLLAEIVSLKKERTLAEPWGEFSVGDLAALHRKGVQVQFFRVPRKIFESLALDKVCYQVTQESDSEICLVTFSLEPVQLGIQPERPPNKSWAEVEREIACKQAKLQELDKEYAALAEHLEGLERAETELNDLLEYRRAVLNARFELDNRLFILQCWSPVPAEELISKIGPSFVVHHYTEEPKADDRVPVLLANPPAFNSGEDLIRVYSCPNYREFDPSPLVLYWFALFFGMIIGDAGYGFVMLGLALYLKKKVRSRSPFAIRFFRLMYILSVSVVFFGVISASYFGMNLRKGNPLLKLGFLDFNSPEGQNEIMLLSIFLGMIHLTLAHAIKLVRQRAYSSIGWILAIWSGYFLVSGLLGKGEKDTLALTGFLVGLFLVFFFNSQGKHVLVRIGLVFPGLLDVSTLFADILSYLRLFALGVATVYMAQTFNMLADSVSQSVPVIGYVFAGLILFAGHGLNIAMGIMGGVIHGLRLNFLEWYRWCFEGDGLPFRPFQRVSERR